MTVINTIKMCAQRTPTVLNRRSFYCALVLGLSGAMFNAVAAPIDDANALVAKMTLEEKIAQLQNNAPAIPRLGIPAYEWWNEGLHGLARAGESTVFPQAIGLAASWNTNLMHQVGTAVSTEARAKFNAIGAGKDHPRYHGLTVWSPNINIFRDPRWGRGQETYGEDPYLTGQLGVAFVTGIQGDDPDHPRAIATPKHFAIHSGPEPGRHGFDVDVSPHDVEATYLPAFRAAVVDGKAGSVMCAYNSKHGTPLCASEDLLEKRLRNDWGFKGFVVTDCDSVYDMTYFHYFRPDNAGSGAAAIKAGTDLNCGNAYADLNKAIARGELDESVIDKALVRLMEARYRLGDLGKNNPYSTIGTNKIRSPEHQQLALQAALESMVLLKNKNAILPLRKGTRLAVVGPNADTLQTLEANYQGTSINPITPLQGLRERFGAENIHYAQGSSLATGVLSVIPETALRSGKLQGLKGEYFTNLDFSGSPKVTRSDRVINFNWDQIAPAEGISADKYSVRWTGQLMPPSKGEYTLGVNINDCFDCRGHDSMRLYVNNELVIESGKNTEATLQFTDTKPQDLRLEMIHSGQDKGINLKWQAPAEPQLVEAEVVLQDADAIVAFVGLSPDVEGEQLQIDVLGFDGGDRTDIALPLSQQALLERVAASGKPLVVVLMSGSAVALNWAEKHADAILAAWYPGEVGGKAIAQVLAGDYNPSGRLPVTFYKGTRDLPPYISYDMKDRTYRYFKGKPLYPFGYGLSYSNFSYSRPTLSTTQLEAGQPLMVTAEVTNTGDKAGDEVVQVYLDYPESPLAPRHALVGFKRVHLNPGEKRQVQFEILPRELSIVSAAGNRSISAGDYQIFVGGGQPNEADNNQVKFSIFGENAVAW